MFNNACRQEETEVNQIESKQRPFFQGVHVDINSL